MGKKKKSRGRAKQAGRSEGGSSSDDLAFNPFAEKLKGIQARKQAEADRKRAEEQARAQEVRDRVREAERQERRVIARDKALETSDVVEMTAEELFEQAVAELDPVQIHSGKYMGRGPDTQNVRIKEERLPSPAEIEALGAPDNPYHDDMAMFEEAMHATGVAPMGSKTYVPNPHLDPQQLYRFEQQDFSNHRRAAQEEAIEALLASEGPVLNQGQRRLLAEYRKHVSAGGAVPEVNVRGETRELALRQLELAVLQAGVHGDRFLKVVTGKGLSSASEPVLKRAVAEWCYGEGEELVVDFAPDVLLDGTYGCIIVAVRRRRRRR